MMGEIRHDGWNQTLNSKSAEKRACLNLALFGERFIKLLYFICYPNITPRYYIYYLVKWNELVHTFPQKAKLWRICLKQRTLLSSLTNSVIGLRISWIMDKCGVGPLKWYQIFRLWWSFEISMFIIILRICPFFTGNVQNCCTRAAQN